MKWKNDWVTIPSFFEMTTRNVVEFDYHKYMNGDYIVFTRGTLDKELLTYKGTLPGGLYEQVEISIDLTEHYLSGSDIDYPIHGKFQLTRTRLTEEHDEDDDDDEDIDYPNYDQWRKDGTYIDESSSYNDVREKFGNSTLDLVMVHKSELKKPEPLPAGTVVLGSEKRFFNLYYSNRTQSLVVSGLQGSDDPVKLASLASDTASLEFIATIDITELPSVKQMLISKHLYTVKP